MLKPMDRLRERLLVREEVLAGRKRDLMLDWRVEICIQGQSQTRLGRRPANSFPRISRITPSEESLSRIDPRRAKSRAARTAWRSR